MQKPSNSPERIRAHESCRFYFHTVSDQLAIALRDIESALELLDARLDELQPGHTGRVRLMWVSRHKSQGYFNERMPVPVEWSRHKLRGTWTAKKIPLRRLAQHTKVSGQFRETSEQVRVVLRVVQDLLETHGRVRQSFSRIAGNFARMQPHITRRIETALTQSGRSHLAGHD